MKPANPTMRDYGLLITLSAIWGSSFMLIKVAVATIPAVSMTAGRLSVATIVMVVVAIMAGQKFPRDGKTWGLIALVAVFGNALPFGLISWGEERVDSGLAAIMMAIMPLTTLLLAHIFTSDEKLNRWKFLGVVLGVVGLVVLMGGDKLLSLGDDIIHQLAIALAAVFYGISALIVKYIRGVPARAMTAGILAISALSIIPVALMVNDVSQISPSGPALMAMITLGVVQTAIAGLLAYFIIRKLGATFFSQLNFMVPLFGVLFGVIFLSENPGIHALLALAIILVGVGVARYGIHKSMT
ncbi:MAG TPA: DMT family transporter [Rhizobiales bacterium]|nr:DMT family transporter [Hyphomicrobiales bacterium]